VKKRIGTEPEQLRKFFSRFTAYLHSPKDTVMEGQGPLFVALQDIWERTLPNVPTSTWPERFITDLSNYFESNAWEAANKKAGRVPSLEEYIHWRQFTVACYPFFDLCEVTQNIKKPENVPELDRLSTMANHVVAFFNDIISFEKELPTGDCHNLVLVLQHEMRCSLQVAMDRAVEMHNLEMRDFLHLEAQIRNDERFRDDVNISEYINGLRYWIRGNLDWSYESGRYLPDGATPNDLIISYFSPSA
jgi:5-epi-alpha-selinene synthase